MKSTKNRVISIIICLLIISQILPSIPFFVPVYANSTETEILNDTAGDITLPIDPFHSLSYVPVKSATCTDNGNKAYYVCSDCGKWFENSQGTVEITDKSSVVIPATGHTPASAVTENEVAATCEADGSYDEVVYCSVCHAEISRKITTVPAIGHDWNEEIITTPATCTTDGVRTYTCKHDAGHTYTEPIPATGHTLAEAVRENEVSATCSVAGSYDEVVYCSVCHEEISRVQKTIPIDEDAHDWGKWVQTKAPTETEPGEETRTCKNDPSHKETREIAPLTNAALDLNGDGAVTIEDVTALLNYLSNSSLVPAANPDLNGSGSVDISDVTTLLNCLSK